MPRREPSAYVWDIRDACQRLKEGLGGVDKGTYLADTMHRLAVERVLIVIGEAMSQLAKLDAALANELGPAAQIVAFRNVLVHSYFKIDHEQVWEVLTTHIPLLHAAADRVWARFAHFYPDEKGADE
jgi:uncharacterized protein with HEPN domain